MMYTKERTLNPVFLNLGEWDISLIRPLLSWKQLRVVGEYKEGTRIHVWWEVGGERGRWSAVVGMKRTPCTATFLVYWQKKYNKRRGWRCGLPRLVSTFLADNKACLCLDEPLWALSFHNPRPLSLCFADPLCQWIKIWAEGMDWAFQCRFIKRSPTHQGLVKSKKEKKKWTTPDSFSSLTHYKCVSKIPRPKTGGMRSHFFTCESVTVCFGAFPSTLH